MKNSQTTVSARREKILAYMKSSGIAKVSDIAAAFHVSELTVRRDFDELASEGKIERFHGGAVLSEPSDVETQDRLNTLSYKQAIAKKAADMVDDYDTIFINSSSTALLLLKYVTAKRITVITNNGKALFAARPDDSILIFTEGEIRFPKNAMVGDFATSNLSKVTASKCFMGCAGISLSHGVMSTVLQEAAINELMIRHTNGEKVILADHRRFDCIHPFRTCAIEEITHLITDTDVPGSAMESFRKRGIKVSQVKPSRIVT